MPLERMLTPFVGVMWGAAGTVAVAFDMDETLLAASIEQGKVVPPVAETMDFPVRCPYSFDSQGRGCGALCCGS